MDLLLIEKNPAGQLFTNCFFQTVLICVFVQTPVISPELRCEIISLQGCLAHSFQLPSDDALSLEDAVNLVDGMTPLLCAVFAEDAELVRLLAEMLGWLLGSRGAAISCSEAFPERSMGFCEVAERCCTVSNSHMG